MSEELTPDGDFAAVQEWFHEQEWTDGLPVVPPTEEAVSAMIASAGESPETDLGIIPPLGVPATVEKVAVNAVMAGCRPEYFPTILSAIRAVLAPEFNLDTIQSTTHPVAPLVIVHGPEARRIGVNGKSGAFGTRVSR